MRLQPKSISKVTLLNLLRRKRMTLKQFLSDNGIITYELLVSRCSSMGVVPPDRENFEKSVDSDHKYQISSPTEGILVLNPPQNLLQDSADGTTMHVAAAAATIEDSSNLLESNVSQQQDELVESYAPLDEDLYDLDAKKKRKKSKSDNDER